MRTTYDFGVDNPIENRTYIECVGFKIVKIDKLTDEKLNEIFENDSNKLKSELLSKGIESTKIMEVDQFLRKFINLTMVKFTGLGERSALEVCIDFHFHLFSPLSIYVPVESVY